MEIELLWEFATGNTLWRVGSFIPRVFSPNLDQHFSPAFWNGMAHLEELADK
jgi:hypothetical protein